MLWVIYLLMTSPKIIPGKYKGAAFKKGQLITKQDIPELLKIGKKNLYIHDIPKTHIHEDEAALYIAETIVGHGKKFLKWTTPCEGKTNIITYRRRLASKNRHKSTQSIKSH